MKIWLNSIWETWGCGWRVENIEGRSRNTRPGIFIVRNEVEIVRRNIGYLMKWNFVFNGVRLYFFVSWSSRLPSSACSGSLESRPARTLLRSDMYCTSGLNDCIRSANRARRPAGILRDIRSRPSLQVHSTSSCASCVRFSALLIPRWAAVLQYWLLVGRRADSVDCWLAAGCVGKRLIDGPLSHHLLG